MSNLFNKVQEAALDLAMSYVSFATAAVRWSPPDKNQSREKMYTIMEAVSGRILLSRLMRKASISPAIWQDDEIKIITLSPLTISANSEAQGASTETGSRKMSSPHVK